jgi:hypothetical protein
MQQYRQIRYVIPTPDCCFWMTFDSRFVKCPNCQEQVPHRPNAHESDGIIVQDDPGDPPRAGWMQWFRCLACDYSEMQDPVSEAQLQVWGAELGGWMPVPDTWQEAAELGVPAAAIIELTREHGELPLHEIVRILGPYFQEDPDALSDAVERYVITANRVAYAADQESARQRWGLIRTPDLPRRPDNMPRAQAVREAITLQDLVTWCEDQQFWPVRGEAVSCRELAERIGASLHESVYVVRYPSGAIDVHELVLTPEGCWLPGPLHGTIEPPTHATA